MRASDVARARLRSQLLTGSSAARCAEVVQTLGPMQAQDDASVLWSLAIRCPGTKLAEVEKAIAEGSVVRSWLLRGTLHVAAAEDVRWLLGLIAPRLLTMRARRRSELELTDKQLDRCETALVRALGERSEDEPCLTRDEALEVFRKAGVPPEGQRGYHVLSHLALRGVICFGPNRGNQHTFVLLDRWVKAQESLAPEEAAARLAARYFAGRAPATSADFSWWSGLPAALVKAGVAALPKSEPSAPSATASAHLLPGFDEYLLGYKERSAVLAKEHAAKVVPGGNGVFLPTIVVNGQVVGTWKRVVGKKQLRITLAPFRPLSARTLAAISAAGQRYGDYLGLPVELA